jgi:hypothetical protein
MPEHKGDGLYHALVGTKILLALGVFFIASVLVGRSAAFESWRADRAKWLKVMVLLAAIIVAMSGFVKVRGKKVRATSPAPQVTSVEGARASATEGNGGLAPSESGSAPAAGEAAVQTESKP